MKGDENVYGNNNINYWFIVHCYQGTDALALIVKKDEEILKAEIDKENK